MPITVICDDCSESHRVRDDAVGKRLKCKGCGKTLTVRAEADPVEDLLDYEAAESDEDDPPARLRSAPRKSKPGSSRSKPARGKTSPGSVPLHRTSLPLGLRLVYFGFVGFVGLLLIAFCIGLTMRNNPRVMIQMLPVLKVLGYLTMVANVVTSVGKVYCLTAPARVAGRGPLIVAVLFDLFGLGVNVASLFGMAPRLLVSFNNLFWVIGMVCFVLFLKEVGRFLKEPDISERASGLLMLGIAIVGMWVVMLALSTLVAAGTLPAAVAGLGIVALAIGVLITGVIGVIRYAGLLNSCLYSMSYD